MSQRSQEDWTSSDYLLRLVCQDFGNEDNHHDIHTCCRVSSQHVLSCDVAADELSIGRTKTTSTTTVTVTSAACSQQKRNAHIDNRGFEYARAADVEDIKRGDILGLLAAFADAKISEGCSCLNLQPKATKTTIFTAATPVRHESCQRS
jgi:hypothetical protein